MLSTEYSSILDVVNIVETGKITKIIGNTIHAAVPRMRMGELCYIEDDNKKLMCECVGFEQSQVILFPLGSVKGFSTQAKVVAMRKPLELRFDHDLRGCVLNGLGEIIDDTYLDRSINTPSLSVQIDRSPPKALERKSVEQPLITGVTAIDSLLSCARGQRVGIFAPAGVGKTTLLSMIARRSDADVIVLGLVGERGREVIDFLGHELGEEGRKRSVVVVSTSDTSSLERIKAAQTATAIAESYRDQGLDVILMIDSITRFARAQRELGLSIGEPPTRNGFPPSVFTVLPQLLERPGRTAKGSISAFYTILIESENEIDVIGEEVKSILDGHIVLSQKLANQNWYPAIDILRSKSRLFQKVTNEPHRHSANQLIEWMAKFKEIELLIRIGEYKPGSDAVADQAIAKMPAIKKFLCQSIDEKRIAKNLMNDLKSLAP
ncbi:MAG: FliI/YscN family ATPase [Pseudomonadota bacterium]